MSERPSLDVDIVCVGFGPATGGFLTELARRCSGGSRPPPLVICYERSDDIGFGVSGAVTAARAIKESFPQLDPAVASRSWLNADKGEVGFGIDLAVRIDPPQKPGEKAGAVGEFFWDGLFNTLFWVDPKNKLAAVLFTQYFPFGKVPLHKDFRDAVYRSLDKEAMPPP